MCSPLINKFLILILIPPPTPHLVSLMSSVGQQAKGFAALQVSPKVRYNGEKGVPVLPSKSPSCWAASWAKRRLVEAVDASSQTCAASALHRFPPVL